MPGLFDGTSRAGLPQTTPGGIYYEIDAFDYREAWVPGANRTQITCRVDATESFEWITQMVGKVYVTAASGGVLARDLPERNPFDSKQYCTRIEQMDQGGLKDGTTDADGNLFDAASGWPFTKWQRYRATFEGMPFQMRSDSEANAFTVPELMRYVYRTQSTYAREQQIPGGTFREIGGTDPLMQTGFKTRCFGDVSYTRVRIPVSNFPAAIKTHRGKVNDAAFDTQGSGGECYNFAAGELLYVGFDDSKKYFDANEDWVCDLVLNFKFCQGGWNFFLRADGVLVEVSTDGTAGGARPYSSETMPELFLVS